MNLIALNLLECTVTLYPTDASGAPILASPIWTGVTVENLTIRERWLKSETKPTGARYPKRHPLIQQYELNLGRVWSLQTPTSDGGFVVSGSRYVLDIVWIDEDTSDWHRETFYGVTVSERSRASRDIDGGFTDEQVFEAEYMATPTGGSGAPIPSISGTLPMLVRYLAAGESSMGGVDLYTYTPATHLFAEATAGISTGRATIAYSGTGVTQAFAITFAGASTPALTVGTDGVLTVRVLISGAPDLSHTPRLDFFYGTQRLASLTSTGAFLAVSFTNATPAAGTGKFQLYGAGVLQATFATDGVVTEELISELM